MTRPLIVHVVNSLGTGGLEHGVANVVNETADHFRHAVVCMTTSGAAAARLARDVEVIEIGKRAGHDVRAMLRLVRTLRALRPAVVHTRNWGAFDAVVAARLAGVSRVIHGEHGREISDPDGRNPRRNRVRRVVSPLVGRFVTVSRDLADWLTDVVGIPARKIVTIVNGVDTGRFAPADRAVARAALRLPLDRPIVGTVGRLDPVKDQLGLLDAFARLAPTRPAPLLIIAGDGPCRDDLARRVRQLGLDTRAVLLGARTDVARVLAAMDVFVLPSIAEGISNTILEAMAAGLPVVATRVGGNPELVEDGGNGRLVPPRDPAALADAIGGYLADPWLTEVHGKTSRARAVAEFSLARMAADYTALWSAVAMERRL